MAYQMFLMPTQGNGTYKNPFKPKYYSLLPAGTGQKYFSPEPVCLVGADLTPETRDNLVANLDVVVYPQDLGLVLGTPDAFIATHEDFGIGVAGWMAEGLLYRRCNRRVIGIMEIAARMWALGSRMLGINYSNLITTYSEQSKANFYQAVMDIAGDNSGITDELTLRQSLDVIISRFDSHVTTLGPGSNATPNVPVGEDT